MSLQFITVICQLLSALLIGICVSCSTTVGNGGLETTNGLNAYVSGDTIYGNTVPHAQLVLCDISFTSAFADSFFLDSAVANDSGEYQFTNIPNGTFNLLAWNQQTDSSAVIFDIPVNENTKGYQDTVLLSPNGSINGVAKFEDENWPDIIISIVGTPLTCRPDSEGYYSIEKVPFGHFSINAYMTFITLHGDIVYSADTSITISSEVINDVDLSLKRQE